MSNSLINGPEAAGTQPAADAPADVIPTWGYKGTESKIFNLKPGETLPSGWADHPSEVDPEPAETVSDGDSAGDHNQDAPSSGGH